ncbi:MAG: helix-turn-helix domain-containing protein [Candidatus Binatia bacterium]
METQVEQAREQFVGTQELMETLSVSRSTVNRMVKRGMPHIWVGSVRRYPLNQVLEWLKNDQPKQ